MELNKICGKSVIQSSVVTSQDENPMSVADTYFEKSVVGTLMAIDTLSYISPFRWIPELTQCGTEETQAEADATGTESIPTSTSENNGESNAINDSTCQDGQTRSFYHGPAGTQNVGICKAGFDICFNGQWETKLPDTQPKQEECNGLDDNCDGELDLYKLLDQRTIGGGWLKEGPAATVWTGDNTLLTLFNSGLMIHSDAQGNILGRTQLPAPDSYLSRDPRTGFRHLVSQMVWTGSECWILMCNDLREAEIIRTDENGNFIDRHATDGSTIFPIKLFPLEEGYLFFGAETAERTGGATRAEINSKLITYQVGTDGTFHSPETGVSTDFLPDTLRDYLEAGWGMDIVKKEDHFEFFSFDNSWNLYMFPINATGNMLGERQMIHPHRPDLPPWGNFDDVHAVYANGRYLVNIDWDLQFFQQTGIPLYDVSDLYGQFDQQAGPRWNGQNFIALGMGVDLHFFDSYGNPKQTIDLPSFSPLPNVRSATISMTDHAGDLWIFGAVRTVQDGTFSDDASVEFAHVGRCDAPLP